MGVDEAMFKCTQTDWSKQFQGWNVIYFVLNVILAIIKFVLAFSNLAGKLKLLAIIPLIVHSVVGLLIGCLLCHLGWFCVVKQQDCCGQTGYLIWGLLYLIFLFWPLLQGAVGLNLLCLLLLIPAFYMLHALFKLFQSKGSFNLLAS